MLLGVAPGVVVPPLLRVRVGDASARAGQEGVVEGSGRIVDRRAFRAEGRVVHVEEVQEQEERLALRTRGERGSHVLTRLLGVDVRDVLLESAVVAELRIDPVRGLVVEADGVIALRAQALRESRDGRREHGVVLPHLVLARIEPGEHPHVRDERPRHRRVGLLEQHALRGEGVDVRRRVALVAVAADVVLPERVDRDQDHVFGQSLAARMGLARRAAAGESGRAEEHEPGEPGEEGLPDPLVRAHGAFEERY
jgi:hypothetical protein